MSGEYLSNNLFITHDLDIGVLYHITTGSLFTTSAADAVLLKEYQNNYLTLSTEQQKEYDQLLEAYLLDKDQKKLRCPKGIDTVSRMESIRIMISTDCNLRCKYCYADGGHYNHERMTVDSSSIRSYLSFLENGKIDEVGTIIFFGGEPLFSIESIIETCEYISELNDRGLLKNIPAYALVTNATLINDEIAKVIAKYNILTTVSIDGPSEIHDALRIYSNGSGTYADVKRSLEILQNNGVTPALAEVTYTKMHLQFGYTIPDIIQHIRNEFNISNVLAVPCKSYDSENELAFTVEDRFGMRGEIDYSDSFELQDYSEDITSALYEDLTQVARMLEDYVFDLRCSAGLDSFAIFPDGKLYPCHLFGLNNDFCFGDVSSTGLNLYGYDGVREKLLSMRKSLHPKCSQCWMRTFCRSCIAPNGKINVEHCEKWNVRFGKVILALAKIRQNNDSWHNLVSRISSTLTEII